MLRKRKQDIKQPKITPSSRKTKVSKQVSKKVIEGKKIKIVAIKDKPTKKLKVSKLKAIIAPTIKVKEKNTSLKLKIKCTKKVKRKKRKIKRVELTCVLTGLKKKLNTVKVREMAVKLRFKDETDFINNFLSRTACTLLKQGYTENEIKQKFNFQSETVVSFDLIKKYIKASNASSGSEVDSNANVENKNITTCMGELPKREIIGTNRLFRQSGTFD